MFRCVEENKCSNQILFDLYDAKEIVEATVKACSLNDWNDFWVWKKNFVDCVIEWVLLRFKFRWNNWLDWSTNVHTLGSDAVSFHARFLHTGGAFLRCWMRKIKKNTRAFPNICLSCTCGIDSRRQPFIKASLFFRVFEHVQSVKQ